MTLRKRSEAGAALADALTGAQTIEEASKPLAEELAKKPATPPLFASANKGPGINPDYEKIVECVYSVDALRDYEDLEKNLEVGEQRGDYATLRQHLDKAEGRARRAHSLYLGAKLEFARWEVDSERVLSGMRQNALDALEEEKANGERRKAITDADCRSKMAEMYSDEWSDQEIKRHRMKGMVESMENLAERWAGKCFSLRTLLETLRK